MNQEPDSIIKMGISGRYRCVLNKGTEREVDTGWFHNLITDIGLDRLATANPAIGNYCSIGTGTTAPVNGNTSLQSYTASVFGPTGYSAGGNIGSTPWTALNESFHTFAQGAVVGNMAEIGMGWSAGGVNLFSRALILDGGGAPTTLTVTSLDQLTVYYELTCAPQITDLTGTVVFGGPTFNYTGRLANSAQFFGDMRGVLWQGVGGQFGQGFGSGGQACSAFATQTLGAITSQPTGTAYGGNAGNASLGSYTPGQKYLDNVFSMAPLDSNAPGGIGSMLLFFTLGQFQYQYSFANASGGATIPKDNTKTMTLTVRFAWDRV